MDPNIMKLLEDDEEDDSMHSGADVDAFAAALNRDIEANNNNNNTSTSHSQSTTTTIGVLPQYSTPNQLSTQSQDSNQEDVNVEKMDEDVKNLQPQDQKSSQMQMIQHISESENQEQEVGPVKEHSQLQLQQNNNHPQEQAEENPHLLSQKGGIPVPEQNFAQLGEQNRMRQSENQLQFSTSQSTINHQMPAGESDNRSKQVSFGMLLPVILPHLDKDRAMQLQTLYTKLRKNEIHKEVFLRHLRNIVGDQMLRQAVHKIQTQQTKSPQAVQNPPTVSHQLQAQSQTSSQQQQLVKSNASQFKDSHPFSQLHQKGHMAPTDPTQVPTTTVDAQSDASSLTKESNVQKRESEHQSDSQGMRVNQVSSPSMGVVKQEKDLSITQGLSKQQQQNSHRPQTAYPMYGANMSNYHAHSYSGQSVGAPSSSLRPQIQDSQARQVPLSQVMVPTQSGGTTQPLSSTSIQNYGIPNSSNEAKRFQGGSFPNLQTHSTLQHEQAPRQLLVGKDKNGTSPASMTYMKEEVSGQTREQHTSQVSASSSSTFSSGKIENGNQALPGLHPTSVSMATQLDSLVQVRHQVPSATASLEAGNNIKTPPKKPSIGQKKPLDAFGAPSSLASKKQKVSGAFLDQSIEQLNDVTTVSGVDLREEEEQLFSGPKEDIRASEATRRVIQEEEERLILQKVPFQKKLAKIMSKYGVKNVSKDIERCLSLCLEERMRGLISNLVRVSKQRVDIEGSRHRTIITSDVRRQILAMNRKAKEDWEKKQAEEAEKLRKITEAEGNTGADGEKDKDEGRTKGQKVNREEDEKMKTTAANVAARVAVGGDDMLSKWQLMAEQARQKRDGVDSASVSHTGKDVIRKPSSATGRTSRETLDGDNRSSSAAASGSIRKFGRSPAVMPHTKVARNISVKDVIAVLEREPQMSKSTLIYSLYERMHADASTVD